MQIKVTYTAKWRLKTAHWYVWTTCKKLINMKSGREVRKVMKGLKAGYYIDRKFVSLVDLKKDIELIPKKDKDMPF